MSELSRDPSTRNEPDAPQTEQTPATRMLSYIDDSLRAEKEWRSKGQKIQRIYKGELDASGMGTRTSRSRFNSLHSNTEILRPSIYQRPPKPEIRSRGIQGNPIIDAASEAIQRVCEVIFDDSGLKREMRRCVQDFLLPGRGIARVRWTPLMQEVPTEQMTPEGQPMMQLEKLLDGVEIEHVYWEDFLMEPGKSWKEVTWVAFRQLFDKKKFLEYFSDSPIVGQAMEMNQLGELFKHTEQSVGKPGYDTDPDTDSSIRQDVIKKALVWEVWDKTTRKIYWICRDCPGQLLEEEDDPYGLSEFFPCPEPLTSVCSTDSLIPVPEYTIYQDLAAEVDDISERIAAIVRRLKVRGAYNAQDDAIKNIIEAEDGEMLGVEGQALDYDINKHIYFVDISKLVQVVTSLYQARNESKQAMYEVTGLSDIFRGATRASETASAQQIKSQYASLRVSDRKDQVETFFRDIVRTVAEIVAEHFSPESIYYLTNVMLPPEAFQVMRNDGLRIAQIDVESDSTISEDDSVSQQAMGDLMASLSMVLQQVGPLVMNGIIPPEGALQLVKFATKPFKFSRDLHKVLDRIMQQFMAAQNGVSGAPGPAGQDEMVPSGPAGPQLVGGTNVG